MSPGPCEAHTGRVVLYSKMLCGHSNKVVLTLLMRV